MNASEIEGLVRRSREAQAALAARFEAERAEREAIARRRLELELQVVDMREVIRERNAALLVLAAAVVGLIAVLVLS